MVSLNGGDFVSSPDMESFLCDLLLDSTQPISERFRALFSLRNLKGPAPRNALIRGKSKLPPLLFFLIRTVSDCWSGATMLPIFCILNIMSFFAGEGGKIKWFELFDNQN